MAGRPWSFIRVRTMVYLGIWVTLFSAACIAVSRRSDILVTSLGDASISTLTQDDAGRSLVTKPVKLSIINKTMLARSVSFTLPEALKGVVTSQFATYELPPNSRIEKTVHVRVPIEAFSRGLLETELDVQVEGGDDRRTLSIPIKLRRPFLSDEAIRKPLENP